MTGQLVRQTVLQEIAGRTGLDAREHVLFVAEYADHHRVCIGIATRRLSNDLDSAHVGQSEVDQQHVGRGTR